MAPPKSRAQNIRPTSKQVPKWGRAQSSDHEDSLQDMNMPQQPSIEPKEQPFLKMGSLGGLNSIPSLDFDVGGQKKEESNDAGGYVPSFGLPGGNNERRPRRMR